jgi:hypothetical protein
MSRPPLARAARRTQVRAEQLAFIRVALRIRRGKAKAIANRGSTRSSPETKACFISEASEDDLELLIDLRDGVVHAAVSDEVEERHTSVDQDAPRDHRIRGVELKRVAVPDPRASRRSGRPEALPERTAWWSTCRRADSNTRRIAATTSDRPITDPLRANRARSTAVVHHCLHRSQAPLCRWL